ncbi:Signal peptidase 22kDa subunit [Neofusicoccum parvum]|uniref:Signal peptidase 22kDa subunit n=1 Tax=Neofusicoccum parvum TaxID=310453 RepID=A0ACB5SBE2_9PEZI|nr:Signal peptidase 22kDa subunit [Neofusicoccum parvum]
MHSTLVRAQNVFGYFTTVAAAVAALIALSVFIQPQTPSGSIKLQNVQIVRGRPHYYSSKKEEYAHIKFDLDADLTSLFNWNTKQVFAYITATYSSNDPSEPRSEAIIWDAILASPSAPWHQNYYIHPDPKNAGKTKRSKSKSTQEPLYPSGEFHLQKQRPKYQITDISGKLANRTDVQLELGWNVQPWVGLLTWADWPPVAKYGGAWKELAGGKSKKFDFPALKGKKEGDTATERGKEANKEGVYW